MFEKLKNDVKDIIKKSCDKEIYPDSNNKNIGIYMIYIDSFNDNKIIPIYIGQTGCGKNRNFQNRYKEHLQEVMALNRLKYAYYKETLLSNFYDGHYKACKIFKYMVEHNCTLNDFHMIVLEEIKNESDDLKELLDKKEKEYISRFLPTFFGFNQINSVSESIKEIFDSIKQFGKLEFSDRFLEYDLEDCENFIKYFGYGYTKFNYYHCYPKSYEAGDDDREISHKLEEKKNILKSKYYDENKFKQYRDELPKLQNKKKRIIKNLENCKKQFEEVYETKIKKYCVENKIGMLQKYQDIIDMLLYQTGESIVNFKNYLKRKKINVNILDVFNEDLEFVKLRKKYVKYEKNKFELECKIDEYRYAERTDDLLRILPTKEYNIFPLKDRYREIDFSDLEDNSVIINFEFSNNGNLPNSWDYYEFNLIKIDYKLNINNKIIEKKNIFIKYEEDEYYPIDYYEKDRGEFKMYKTPFNIRNFPYYISTIMEYHNGINEYTLQDKDKVEFELVLDEINLLINEQTKVKIEVRNKLKNKCREFIRDYYSSENTLKNKILAIK